MSMYPISDYLVVHVLGKDGDATVKNENRSLVAIEGFDLSDKLKHNFIKTPAKEYSFVSVFVFDKELKGILTERRNFIDKTTGEAVDKDCAVRIKVDYERCSGTPWTTEQDSEVAQMAYPIFRSTKVENKEAGTTVYEYEDTGDVVNVISKDNPAIAYGTRLEWNKATQKTEEVMVKWQNGSSAKVDPSKVGA